MEIDGVEVCSRKGKKLLLTNMKLGIEIRMWVMEKNGEIGGMDIEGMWTLKVGNEREKRGMKNRKGVDVARVLLICHKNQNIL
ncbi:hypothetical protein DVH24_020024 [Malus domestica]|uniref:Uncharacterized protein n=1 Tax=Malus domestica TaxID=3750 RepID=A0A498JCA6_MALDO|nr:hypothetical protein DVH24_020024 [Malus domestica]